MLEDPRVRPKESWAAFLNKDRKPGSDSSSPPRLITARFTHFFLIRYIHAARIHKWRHVSLLRFRPPASGISRKPPRWDKVRDERYFLLSAYRRQRAVGRSFDPRRGCPVSLADSAAETCANRSRQPRPWWIPFHVADVCFRAARLSPW